MEQSNNPCVAARTSEHARNAPNRPAIIEALSHNVGGAPEYKTTTYGELDRESDRIAQSLLSWGVRPGMKLVLLVPFGSPFIAWVLALLKAGVVMVLVDPGMGRKKILSCLQELEPDGFITVSKVQAMRWLLRRKFPKAIWNVTVDSRWGWGGQSLLKLFDRGSNLTPLPKIQSQDLAAVIFTTGSTGPPKGVAYTHAIFNHQVDMIQQQYGLVAASKDLACFPLFGLFDCVMGLTTVIPRMDPTRPADVDPRMILDAVRRFDVEQAFGSPALWNTVVRYCESNNERLPQLKCVLSAGAPVPPHVLQGLRNMLAQDARIYTPYGATESLPVASIESRTILEETAEQTRGGSGTCVGQRFPEIEWRVIEIVDGPLKTLEQCREVPRGTIGELMVSGPVVTERYITRPDQNALHKVREGDRIWHRMGDVGYLDAQDRFWFCGRKAQRVKTQRGTLYTEPCEAVMNAHPKVYRSALVGRGAQEIRTPAMVIETWPDFRPGDGLSSRQLVEELREWAKRHTTTEMIEDIRLYPDRLPVDIRHNSKIFREQLAEWVARKPT